LISNNYGPVFNQKRDPTQERGDFGLFSLKGGGGLGKTLIILEAFREGGTETVVTGGKDKENLRKIDGGVSGYKPGKNGWVLRVKVSSLELQFGEVCRNLLTNPGGRGTGCVRGMHFAGGYLTKGR